MNYFRKTAQPFIQQRTGRLLVVCTLSIFSAALQAQSVPSGDSVVGDKVSNPLIAPSDPATTPANTETTVTGLEKRQPTSDFDYTQFVFTGLSGALGDNDYAFLVRGNDEFIYKRFDGVESASRIVSVVDSVTAYTSPTVTIARDTGNGDTTLETFFAWQTYADWQSKFASPTVEPTAPDLTSESGGPDGVDYVRYGGNGGNGSTGVFFWPATSGDGGGSGPTFTFDTSSPPNSAALTTITAVNKIGLKIGTVGGSGGNGGSVYLSPYSAQRGGNGGAAGNLTVLNKTTSIKTSTTNGSTGLHGIYAFSQSGAGGKGGSGYGAVGGGSGGGSANGGRVTVESSGNIETNSDYSYGIYGLSSTGNGGGGGSQYGIAGSSGSGAGAANGGTVSITTTGGQIVTRGLQSYGILAQSVGGSGGSSGDSGNLIYSGGANAQQGGDGGNATIVNEAEVFTFGENSQGIAAQSIGGGGGNSGSSWGLVAIGGTADNGGIGGNVSVSNKPNGLVQTQGDGSTAIFAQSVGGSGGRGGNAAGLVALGGDGAVGGGGGTVTVANEGTLKTFGDTSRGIFAESVGGGGGSGGSTVAMISVGGSGSGGGNGNDVTVTNTGIIVTTGDNAQGIYAQSVGGGGGDGGSSVAVGAFLAVAVGGDGSTGGDGGKVKVILGGAGGASIRTGADADGGFKSTGVFAQSVGGGGGSGGGALAVSVGAFGSVSVALGGTGGEGGAGGVVELTTPNNSATTDVTTKGNEATGIYLQSVGGGGGDGGYAYSFAAAAGPVSGTVNVGIGGKGGSGGEGGEVTVGQGFPLNPSVNDLLIYPISGFKGNITTDGERSTGLLAQSVGGGGGNGGLAISAGVSVSVGGSIGVSVGIGGDGGPAGDGGLVRIATEGDITTNQTQSTALLVQSVGGGGGNGGGSVAAGFAGSAGGAATINIGGGGDGGEAGHGGKVTLVTGSGNILTRGILLNPELDIITGQSRETGGQSAGIIAQSIGGGGGNGGYSVAAGVAGAGGAAGAVSVALGGTGGGGGNGGDVFAQMASNVTTLGDSSAAILTQSIGGGGGNGGYSVSVAGAGAGGGAGAVAVGLGGAGGPGGVGSEVIASSSGIINTLGSRSAGFTAQSIGGGGGNGAFNVSAGLAGAGGAAGAVNVGLGGKGGTGNDGGEVYALTSGDVTTGDQALVGTESQTSDSVGILAQSVGGGGGNGGFNVSASGSGAGGASGNINVGLGGEGTGGGDGKKVELTVGNNVTTYGHKSNAVVAQSVGGGGGNGGFNVSATATGSGGASGAVNVGLGGGGGVAGDGGVVIAGVNGVVSTVGDDSYGVLAQSLGGGGGNGAFNVSVAASGAGVASGTVNVGLGGDGAGGGKGDAVTSHFTGVISTTGDTSKGFVAQSLGGGGGNGGFNVNVSGTGAGTASGAIDVALGGAGGIGVSGGEIDASVTGDVSTEGKDSSAILAQSVGGGGGDGGFNVSVSGSGAGVASGAITVGLGGAGAGGGRGGSVELLVLNDAANSLPTSGVVSTMGDNSVGIAAQTIGGAGGNGGFNVTVGGSGAGTVSGSVQVGLGGGGGVGGSTALDDLGKAVVVDLEVNKRQVTTQGEGSHAVVAQSIAGGGGNGGFNVTVGGGGAGTVSGNVGVGLGGSGGGGASAGRVEADVIADLLKTTKQNSYGFIAQSLGGGGGNGGFNIQVGGSGAGTVSGNIGVGIGGSGAKGGDGGVVDASYKGSVEARGQGSGGVLAQSVGGSGGNGGFNVTVGGSGAGTVSGTVAVGLGGSAEKGGIGKLVALDVNRNSGPVTNNVTTVGGNAIAILAQSVGGGGGNGGFNVNASGSGAGTVSGNVNVGLGGTGGDGGESGEVNLWVENNVRTEGVDSHGVIAQSIGGGGGNGGFNVNVGGSGAGTASGNVNVALGGKGADGGVSGKVTANVFADIETIMSTSSGFLAQSIGGGGGNGGFNVSAGGSGAGTGSAAVTVGLGGNGGTGGNSGVVDATFEGNVQTRGAESGGVIAQSIGGGGGNGGFTVNVAGSGAGTGSGSVGVSLGGQGGAAGNSEEVFLKVRPSATDPLGKILTNGDSAIGVLAQSVGGGGGNGGFSVGVSGSGAGSGSGSVAVGLGGSGGGGGTGARVELTVDSDVITQGKNSSAIVAQSIGGGGGNGGFDVAVPLSGAGKGSGAVGVGLGGTGGTASSGGTVIFRGEGTVLTGDATEFADGNVRGDLKETQAYTFVATGDENRSDEDALITSMGERNCTDLTVDCVALVEAALANGDLTLALDAGEKYEIQVVDAMTVNIVVYQRKVAKGDFSQGIVVQSIGGGGGNGGFDVSAAVSGAGKGSGALSVGLGGDGEGGGNGGLVDSLYTGAIQTAGFGGNGLTVQSIGGGGGNGAFSVSAAVSGAGKGSGTGAISLGGSGMGGGNGLTVDSVHSGTVYTLGDYSDGVVVQSIGGGGGNGAFSVAGGISVAKTGSGALTVGIGGSGGAGGSSGSVTGIQTGNVTTLGDFSSGVIVQSLGGGGGNGGFSVSGNISAAKSGSGALGVGIGGMGGDAAFALDATSTVTGLVQTSGNNSDGVFTQSLGGGGGNGGFNVTGVLTASKEGSGNLGVGIGGFGGTGGYASAATSKVIGGVLTKGNNSNGVVTQSLGGGGGNGGFNVTGSINLTTKGAGGNIGVGIGGFGGDGGNAGIVQSTVTMTDEFDRVSTQGNNSVGIIAQSVGGGGGNGATNVTGTINATSKSGGSVGFGLGGFGASAGNGTAVTLNVDGLLVTQGTNSHGILAQSVGGGGGNGGINVTGSIGVTKSTQSATQVGVAIGIGGFGGNAGTSGDVTVTHDGSIYAGMGARELIAEVTDANGDVTPAYYVLRNVPGIHVPETQEKVLDEDGEPVLDDAGEQVYTTTPEYYVGSDGFGASGLIAQSIGGGGGAGGINVSGSISAGFGDEADGYGIVVGVGGFGGLGGDAGEVDVDVTSGGEIVAAGKSRSGVLAQSIGGGGGDGGTNVSGSISTDAPLLVGVGGFGADAGIGKLVDVNVAADIDVLDADNDENTASAGIMAQSIGGGGGNGGLNVTGGLVWAKSTGAPSINVGVGGFGGDGAISGDVNVQHEGTINVAGNYTHGIMAQSIGGGGGNGGTNISGQINGADSEESGGKTDVSIIAGVGGNGGEAAGAGDVNVIQVGQITTTGDYSRGIVAQSIGGGGGVGGMNITAIIAKKSAPISVGVGGSGGIGGHAGSVTVNRGDIDNDAELIATGGHSAYGIEASSIGGGGGDAGMNFNVAYTKAGGTVGDKKSFAANFAIGGSGGGAGNGAAAAVNNYSDIYTVGDTSHGILSQSIGGGGGNANFNIAVSYADASTGPPSTGKGAKTLEKIKDFFGKPTGEYDPNTKKNNENLGFSLAVGGMTGDGGDGAASDVVHQGDISTFGYNAYGILSQSIGGGGGNAGMDMAMVLATGGNLGITLGREGGSGGDGGAVTLSSSGDISTTGYNSFGLLAQSIGNGGGNSSVTTVAASVSKENAKGDQNTFDGKVSVGLEGGVGGKAGDVTLDAAGSVITRGENSHAIFAQSVGGGGGNGGAGSTAGKTAASFAVSVGGKGGEGGIGGAVNVISSAQVHTFNKNAVGILAQSVGGGGGTGGRAASGGIASKKNGFNMTVGGGGGVGNIGGVVDVDNSGVIITDGVGSHGVLAQSLGGGGGNAGMSINVIGKVEGEARQTRVAVAIGGTSGNGDESSDVTVTNTGGIGTKQANSVGIFAQSIGGGGGNSGMTVVGSVAGKNGGNNLSVGIGGTGGIGAKAKNVTVNNYSGADETIGGIITTGEKSHGIAAMSIGGGGGSGSSTTVINRSPGDVNTVNNISFTLGGAGSKGGAGGKVVVDNKVRIETFGDQAHAILAQSIGGGGGTGGMSVIGDASFGSGNPAAAALNPVSSGGKTINVSLGGSGGSGDAGGDVLVTNSGEIDISGDRSYGILAQSVGGGGGDGGMALSLSKDIAQKTDLMASLTKFALGGSGGDGADGGDVTITNSGSITVRGDDGVAIFAQSVGGGGGNTGSSISSPVWMAGALVIDQLLGARDGINGVAGVVDVQQNGDIRLLGDGGRAVVTQTINGGGGNTELYLDISQQAVELGDDGFELPDNSGDVDKANAYVAGVIKTGTDFVGTGADYLSDLFGFDATGDFTGSVSAEGKDTSGLLMQSVGGGGGSSKTTVFVAEDGESEVDLEAELGGTGLANSGGGSVTYSQAGAVQTLGDHSQGASVQSIGGGGGNVTLRIYSAPQVPVAAPSIIVEQLVAPKVQQADNLMLAGQIGGTRILDSAGGEVGLNRSGAIVTLGDYSPGLVAQSIGGGGGQLSVIGITDLALSIGGTDGSTGDGGAIDIISTGDVLTQGTMSHGVVVQSIGGGGGLVLSDTDANRVSLAKNADNAGNGGAINYQHNGSVQTDGKGAYGVAAQSLGGGGGIVDNIFFGSAGGAGTGGDLLVSLAGSATVGGDNGIAVLAQSEARDGAGNIGFDVSGTVTAAGDFSTGVLGITRSSAISGDLEIQVGGNAIASGTSAVGIDVLVQGQFSVGEVKVGVDGNVFATGASSTGLRGGSTANIVEKTTQLSVGGSAVATGTDAVAIDLSIKAEEDVGGIGVSVGGDLVATGNGATGAAVVTDGERVGGNIALAVGGSLFALGEDVAGFKAVSESGLESGDISASVDGDVYTQGNNSVAIDLNSRAAGSAGIVDLVIGATLSAYGDSTRGVMLHSEGNGFSDDVSLAIVSAAVGEGSNLTLIELTSSSGDSSVSSSSPSSSAYSAGAMTRSAQSTPVNDTSSAALNSDIAGDVVARLGGSLAIAGQSSRGVVLTSFSAGSSGDVLLEAADNLVSTGDDSSIVVARSIGGQRSGNIQIDLSGSVAAMGERSTAITAQSYSAGSAGDITIANQAGQLLYAGSGGVGVQIEGGLNNQLILRGESLTGDGIAGNVVVATTGNDMVENYGVMTGQFDLGAGTNRFVNTQSAIFIAGPALFAGTNGNSWLANSGSIVIGASGFAQSTTLQGNFEQTASGATYAELDFAADTIDQILATETVKLDGSVYLTLLNPQLVPAGEFSKVLFGGEAGVEDAGLKLITAPSLVINYAVDYSSGTAAALNYEVDFSPDWLSYNAEVVGDYLNDVQNAGSALGLSDVITTLLYQDDRGLYAASLRSMTPQFYGEQTMQLVKSSQTFANRMLSCKQAGGDYRFTSEGNCTWVYAGFENLEYDAWGTSQFDSDVYAMGAQFALGEHWFAGIGASHEEISGKGNSDAWHSDGTTTQAGLSLKYQSNAWKFSGVLSYATSETETVRNGQVVEPFVARVDRDSDSLGLLLVGSYDFEFGMGYVRPVVELGASRIEADEAAEIGADVLNLILEGSSETFTWVRPAVETGIEYLFESDTRARLYARVGVRHYFGDDYTEVQAGLQAVDTAVNPISMEVGLGQDAIIGTAGIDVLFSNEMTLQFQYRYETADNLELNAGLLKFTMPF